MEVGECIIRLRRLSQHHLDVVGYKLQFNAAFPQFSMLRGGNVVLTAVLLRDISSVKLTLMMEGLNWGNLLLF